MPGDLINIENILNMDYRILSIIAILLFLSLLTILLGIRHLLKGKIIAAGIQNLSGISLLLASLLLLSIAINLYSYERLTYEREIAELKFRQIAEQQYQLDITYKNDNTVEQFLINGDEWQIDARVIKWRGWAQILGLDAQYRLERVSGRYSDIDEELNKTRTVYSLNPKDQIDYWKLINKYNKYLPWIDAYYGSAAYLPMANDASYSVSLTQSGLIARSLDSTTSEKINNW
jgi:hypothetical protein